ncbi:unnamed protein product [marine sediment metagenome]|uniref:Uncharacterized protein n=1 Tax=marine sediment metagenome TaxID=412755 RepID=X1FK06_9ZZZZ
MTTFDNTAFDATTAFDGTAFDARPVGYGPAELTTFDLESFMAFATNLKPTHHPN